ELISLMKQQVTVLHRIDRRQAMAGKHTYLGSFLALTAAPDVSTQPFAQVAETSSSVWGALLRSRIAEDIQPQVDRWRSGLDALLVFLGLFSAVVTSFLVDSLTGLRQDEAVRTNELLANLTEILVQLGTGANSSTLKVSAPVSFQPDAVDVRLNSYWSISLILSLSIAALAVACRGFVNMTMMSSRTRAVDKVIDINTRWKGAEKVLGPTLEIIPQLLITPVILFVVGLLDRLFSSILGLGAFLHRSLPPRAWLCSALPAWWPSSSLHLWMPVLVPTALHFSRHSPVSSARHSKLAITLAFIPGRP
ncbi:hypothetical protein B0H17DRAFT_959683, partial [Mycena rosella]